LACIAIAGGAANSIIAKWMIAALDIKALLPYRSASFEYRPDAGRPSPRLPDDNRLFRKA
jgi:hypothetical protein